MGPIGAVREHVIIAPGTRTRSSCACPTEHGGVVDASISSSACACCDRCDRLALQKQRTGDVGRPRA